MSRRPATCFSSLLTASLAAIVLTGCGGSGHDAPTTPPVAVETPAEEPQPNPPETVAPAAAVEAPPVAPADTAPAVEPPSTSETSIPGTQPPSPTADPAANPQQQQPDALQWMRDSEARKADYQRRLAEAQVNVENAKLSVSTWERNVLAFKNPFLARPKLSPEESQAVAGMDGKARVDWADRQLAATIAMRDAAQKTLDELKANPPPS